MKIFQEPLTIFEVLLSSFVISKKACEENLVAGKSTIQSELENQRTGGDYACLSYKKT